MTKTRTVMFVCTANVCRSPIMALTFAQAVRGDTHDEVWDVSSAGVDVGRVSSICEVAAQMLEDEPSLSAAVAAHLSAPLTVEDIEAQDVIFTASRAERAAVARLSPISRSKTFTIREALALGAAPLTSAELDQYRETAATPLARYAAVLNARRGTVPLEPPLPRKLPWFKLPARRVVHPYDVPDAHHEKLRQHVATLKQLRQDVVALEKQVETALIPEARDD